MLHLVCPAFAITLQVLKLDALFVLVTVAFFVLAIAYVAGCERLRKGDR